MDGKDSTLFFKRSEIKICLSRKEKDNDVFAFLEVSMKDNGDGSYTLTQEGLIRKILEVTKMADCEAKSTPTTTLLCWEIIQGRVGLCISRGDASLLFVQFSTGLPVCGA
jgi:hypothetical protein